MKFALNSNLRPLQMALLGSMTVVAVGFAGSAMAENRVTYKSAKAGTSYYQMGVELAQAMKEGTNGDVIVTLEESQGSVQNVMEAPSRKGNYVFTTPPSLVAAAENSKGAFEKKPDEKYKEIRALFPIPSLTMHFVTREDAGIKSFEDMAGKNILVGKGTFSANEGTKYLNLFGLDGKVNLANVELNNAVPALKNKQIDAFVTAGSFPSPNVIEAAASLPIHVLSMSDDQVKQTGAARAVIPANTYNGQTEEIVTTSLPVIAYTTTEMDDGTAYTLTKTFWEQRDKMAGNAPWWNGVTPEMLMNVSGKMHPGALKYYAEKGIEVPATAK
ncbi:TAXI family TRAP transporter solute-binding subunit [Orrella sp. 11846]|uniref:TAXI family TRAP transporter solute-binding subunit n=1 Tax=Orrella sp. 11846 TaxID=3409913 RepID=UPI003B5C17DC